MITDHIKIDPFTANNQQLFRYYDELNSTVYGLYKSGVLDSNEFDFREYIPGAFHDFTSYIQAMDRLHEEFRNQRNASGQTKAADGGVDALMNLANEVVDRNSAQLQSTPTSQIDKVSQNLTARNVGQLNATVQAANSRVNASVTPEDVTDMLKSKRVDSKTAAGITDAIVASLNGQELTRTQSERLSSALGSPTVQSVISELMKKKSDGIDSTLKNAYDEINTIGGNENGREATLWNLSNQRADGSLQSLQAQTRAEDGNGSGVPGTLREIGGLPTEALSATQRRGLTSETDTFGDNDCATLTEGSALHKVQSTFLEEYGIECYVIKDTSWTRSSPAYSRNGIVYIREGIDADTLATAVPHEATHIMKQQSFQPYIDFISCTPDTLNFQSATIERLLNIVAKHKNINPFTANDHELFNFYDELNSIVYGLYKSGVFDKKGYDFREAIPGAFNDFTSYIQELDRIHEQFRNRRNAPAQAKVADGGVDTLMNLANEVVDRSSAQLQSTPTSQIDKVSQNPTARNVGQLNATVQAANNQADAVVNQADVAKSLRSKGVYSKEVDGIAEAIVARLNGQELTRLQRSTLSSALNSSAVRNTISEFIKKKTDGIDSTQNRGYDDSNTRDSLTNEASTTSWNLSNQSVDTFSDHDYGTVIDGAALHQFQNAFSEETYEGDASVPRPTWRQSELDAVADFPEYTAQKSFLNGKEVPYGTKGSVRPDYYKSGFSVDIKNYNVESASGRSNLARNIETQYSQRIENLPDGTKQAVLIDVRGQNVSISALIVLYNDIIQRTNNGVEILFKMN